MQPAPATHTHGVSPTRACPCLYALEGRLKHTDRHTDTHTRTLIVASSDAEYSSWSSGETTIDLTLSK